MKLAKRELGNLFREKYNLELSDTELEQEMRDLLYIYAFAVGKLSILEGYSFII